MQRRQFIEKSGTAMLAVAGLPALMKRNRQNFAQYTADKTDASNGKWSYELRMVIDSINRFTAASDENKQVFLKVQYRKTATSANPDKTAEYSYKISNVILLEASPKKAEMHTKFISKVSGDLALPPELPKDLNGITRPYLDVVLLDTRGKEYINLKYGRGNTTPVTDDDDDDCFLTTACVHHKGLADDCYELQTLRFLRENYMRGNQHGDQLLQQYKTLGPSVLNAIRDADNRPEILDHLYNYLVLPSVEYIERGQYKEAVNYYEQYVHLMERSYLQI